nr:MAG TPA: hypothetical protein [Crassvirales sp.]
MFIVLVAFILLFFACYYDVYCDIVMFNGSEYLVVWYTYKGARRRKILLKL